MHIDNIIQEQEEIIDRVKKIDDQLKSQNGGDMKSAKEELIQRAVNAKPPTPTMEPIQEVKEERPAETKKLKPTKPKEESSISEKVNLKSTSQEINILQKLLNDTEMLNEIIRLSQMMIDAKIDFRILEFMKRGVNSQHSESDDFIKIPEFHEHWRKLIKPEVAQLDSTIEDKILHFVTTKDGEKIDKNRLFTLIDFYQYYPVYVQRDRNFSKEMYYVMSSNTDGGYNWKEGKHSSNTNKQPNEMIYLLEYINDKIKEKYPKMAQAYRFFDTCHKSAIDLKEFTAGLKNLKIVITDEETEKVFKFLDKNNDGLLTYNEF